MLSVSLKRFGSVSSALMRKTVTCHELLLFLPPLLDKVHANCRLRRIFFSDRVYSEDELPPEFKIVIPSHSHISD